MVENGRFDKFVTPFMETFEKNKENNFVSFRPIPSLLAIEAIIEDFMELLFPGRSDLEVLKYERIRSVVLRLLQQIGFALERQIFLAYYHENHLKLEDDDIEAYQKLAAEAVNLLFTALPALKQMMKEDAQAAFDGDPAATSVREAILTYPGVRALTIHRISHFLYRQKVPLVPRMLNETIHKQTGIDIHPGASIGRCLFIDHGTGVVIGETTIIGNQVKIYQGVTLGALSFPKDACGALVRGTKRHPTIKDRVTIYANATILGDITIGENTIIGSSAWIRHDVSPNVVVQNEEPINIVRDLPIGKVKKEC
ncbi:MAG: serine O-acetyltransferase EpsC [Sphaerochaetaceae bacterium]